MKNLQGMTFSRLLVKDLHGIDKNNHYQWLCECECGKDVIATTTDITTGHTKSCGCLRNERIANLRKNMTQPTAGSRFGLLQIIGTAGRDATGRLLVSVQCECGQSTTARWRNVASGNTKSCGCQKYAGLRAHASAPKHNHPWRRSFVTPKGDHP